MFHGDVVSKDYSSRLIQTVRTIKPPRRKQHTYAKSFSGGRFWFHSAMPRTALAPSSSTATPCFAPPPSAITTAREWLAGGKFRQRDAHRCHGGRQPATVKLAIAAQADLLLVHHGLFWSPTHPWTGKKYELLRALIENNIAVYSSHLPLDAHPKLGNNTQLAAALGFKKLRPFSESRSAHRPPDHRPYFP